MGDYGWFGLWFCIALQCGCIVAFVSFGEVRCLAVLALVCCFLVGGLVFGLVVSVLAGVPDLGCSLCDTVLF